MEKLKPSLQAFATELHHTLDEVKSDKEMSTKTKAGLLVAAQKKMVELQKKLVEEQENLLKEDVEQKESVLMGVLMTRQNKPIEEQLEVMKSDDFKDLPVVQAVLKKDDKTTPLFKQVAMELDSKEGKKAPAAEKKTEEKAPQTKAEAKAVLLKVATMLENNLKHMKKTLKQEEELHKKHMASLDAGFKKVAAEKTALNSTSLANEEKGKTNAEKAKIVAAAKKKALETMDHLKKVFAALKKQESRQYNKWHVQTVRDVHNLEKSVVGIKKGDVKAVENARAALVESMQAMQAQSGDFLHFLQTGDSLRRTKDCPYCAAQCLEKCHTAGKSYVTCMTVDCKDAGKGF